MMHRGDRVGARFEILGEASRGGTGTVFRARDLRDERDVAVKVVAAQTAEESARFAREAEILATLAHPGIAGYVAHGDRYLVMEWVEGETLAARLAREVLPAREAVAIAAETARALAALHAAGIVHRDVKPTNLVLTIDQPKLVDLGIARSTPLARLAPTGGTAGYIAPEQARGDRAITGTADIFALGCVLHECLTGAPAFRGDTAIARRAKVLLHDPPRLGVVAPALPAALDALVDRLLARDAQARPAAPEVAACLDDIARTQSLAHGAPPIAACEEAAGASDQPACAVLVALDDADAIERALLACGASGARTISERAFASRMVRRFAGGAIAICTYPTVAARLALELAAQLPAAMIAVACGRSVGDAIDRSARLVEQLAIAAESGAATDGAWLDDATAQALGDRAVLEHHGNRVRLRGGAS